jgi:hypothetical protein
MQEIQFRIVLERPVAGVDIGLQKGKGNAYETIYKQRAGSDNMLFEFSVSFKEKEGHSIDFSGPLVHGNFGERFLYLDIGTYAGQSDSEWSRRLKIPLTGIAAGEVEQAKKKPHTVFEVRIEGRGKDGGPSCGTVKPFDGWKLK